MKKVVLVLALLAVVCFGRSRSTGWKNQCSIPVAGTSVAYSTETFDAAGGLTAVLLLKVNDTTEAGFASDSIEIGWGYQLGYLTTTSTSANGSGGATDKDTAWTTSGMVSVDTVAASGLGASDGGSYSTAQGIATYTWSGASGEADTTRVTGYAVQVRRVQIPHADLVRFYVDGLADNNDDTLDCIIEPHFEN